MTTWIRAPKPYEIWTMPNFTDLDGPGVYTWRRPEGSYVGSTGVLRDRIGDHQRAGLRLDRASGSLYPTDSLEAARRLETALIYIQAPTENTVRPDPGMSVWAGCLGLTRPISWCWYQACGHVLVGGHALTVMRLPECQHLAWDHTKHVRDHVASLDVAVSQAGYWYRAMVAARHKRLDAEVALGHAQEQIMESEARLTEAITERDRLADLLASLEIHA